MKILWDTNVEGGAGQPSIEDPASLLLEEQEDDDDGEEEPSSGWPGANRF